MKVGKRETCFNLWPRPADLSWYLPGHSLGRVCAQHQVNTRLPRLEGGRGSGAGVAVINVKLGSFFDPVLSTVFPSPPFQENSTKSVTAESALELHLFTLKRQSPGAAIIIRAEAKQEARWHYRVRKGERLRWMGDQENTIMRLLFQSWQQRSRLF